MKTKTSPRGKTVLGRLVARTLDFAEAEGMDRRTLVVGAGLERLDLYASTTRVPFSAQTALWRLIRTRTSDRTIGLRLGAALRVRELGLLGYAMYYSPTLRGALGRLVRYGRLINEVIGYRFESKDAEHVVVLECPLSVLANLQPVIDTRVAAVLGVAREITGVDLTPVSVSFAYERPASTIWYSDFFRCPVSFGAAATKLTLKPRDLDLAVPRGDEQVAGFLSEHCETVLRTLTSGVSAADRVRTTIWATLSEIRPTLQGAAGILGVSPRTLQRQLADEGTSFTAELDQVRWQMAVAALRDPTVSIDDVAYLLGYAEPSTFYRSFRRWTGRTPHKYRQPSASPRPGAARGVPRNRR